MSQSQNQLGMKYLQEYAYTAHVAGDGFRVKHLTCLALSLIKKDESNLLDFPECRWAVFLSLFWHVGDESSHRISEAIESLSVEGISEFDKAISTFLVNGLDRPPSIEPLPTLPTFDATWIKARQRDLADIAAICLAIEIVWFDSPKSSNWQDVAENVLEHCSDNSLLQINIKKLVHRLGMQAKICLGSGGISKDQFDILGDSWDLQQLSIGWHLFYEGKTEELDKLLKRLSKKISTSNPAYKQLFDLAHFSRIERHSAEDQFVSLSRLNDATKTNPSYAYAKHRQQRFNSTFRTLAESSFNDNKAHDRWCCLRIAMLSQLSSLRQWDIGGWITARRSQATMLLELGARGDANIASQAIIDLVRACHFPDPKAHPFVSSCLSLLDALSQKQRHELVEELISAPRRAWGPVNTVLARISDSIEDSQLIDTVKWSVRLEQKGTTTGWSITWLKWWAEVLSTAESAEELANELMPALKMKLQSPNFIESACDVLIAVIVKAENDKAIELLNIVLTKISENNGRIDDSRVSIAYAVAMQRPELKELCANWISEQTNVNPDYGLTGYYEHLLRGLREEVLDRNDDHEYRKWLRQRILQFCADRMEASNQTGSISLSVDRNHGLVLDLEWKEEPELIAKITEVIDTEYVPYTNKWDLVACLAALATRGPESQADQISVQLYRWLKTSIPGRDLGSSGGPLSAAHFSGMDASAIQGSLWFLCIAIARNAGLANILPLFDWAVVNCPRALQDAANDATQLSLTLAIRFWKTDLSKAMGLVAIAESSATRVQAAQLPQLVDQFSQTILQDRLQKAGQMKMWAESSVCKFCLQLWKERLIELSVYADPNVRESVANALCVWRASDFNFPPELEKARQLLIADCRGRVRQVFQKKDESIINE